MNVYSNREIIKDLKRVYAKLERPFTRRDYEVHGEVSKSTVERRFGTWTDALREAKLLSKFERQNKKAKVTRR